MILDIYYFRSVISDENINKFSISHFLNETVTLAQHLDSNFTMFIIYHMKDVNKFLLSDLEEDRGIFYVPNCRPILYSVFRKEINLKDSSFGVFSEGNRFWTSSDSEISRYFQKYHGSISCPAKNLADMLYREIKERESS